MEDVIKSTGQRFGVHEAFTLLALALAAIPTSFVIFLEIVTTEEPEVTNKFTFYSSKKSRQLNF